MAPKKNKAADSANVVRRTSKRGKPLESPTTTEPPTIPTATTAQRESAIEEAEATTSAEGTRAEANVASLTSAANPIPTGFTSSPKQHLEHNLDPEPKFGKNLQAYEREDQSGDESGSDLSSAPPSPGSRRQSQRPHVGREAASPAPATTPGPAATPIASPVHQIRAPSQAMIESSSSGTDLRHFTRGEDEPETQSQIRATSSVVTAGRSSGRTRLPTSREPRTITRASEEGIRRTPSASTSRRRDSRDSRDNKSQSLTPVPAAIPTPTRSKFGQDEVKPVEESADLKGKGKEEDLEKEKEQVDGVLDDSLQRVQEEARQQLSLENGGQSQAQSHAEARDDKTNVRISPPPPAPAKKFPKLILKRSQQTRDRNSVSRSPTPGSAPPATSKIGQQESRSEESFRADTIQDKDAKADSKDSMSNQESADPTSLLSNKEQKPKMNFPHSQVQSQSQLSSLSQTQPESETQPQTQSQSRSRPHDYLRDLNDESSDEEGTSIKRRKLSAKKSSSSLFQEKNKTTSGRMSTSKYAKVNNHQSRDRGEDTGDAEDQEAMLQDENDEGSGDEFKDPKASSSTHLSKKGGRGSMIARKRNRDELVKSDISDSEMSDDASDESDDEDEVEGKRNKRARSSGKGRDEKFRGKDSEKKSNSTSKEKAKSSSTALLGKGQTSNQNHKQPKKTVSDMLGKHLGTPAGSSPSLSNPTLTSKNNKVNTPSSSNPKSKLFNSGSNSNTGNSTPLNQRSKAKGFGSNSLNPLSSLLGLEPKPSTPSTAATPSNKNQNDKDDKDKKSKAELDKAKMRAKLVRDKERDKDKGEKAALSSTNGQRSYATSGTTSSAVASEPLLDQMSEHELIKYKESYREKINDVSDCFDLTVQNDMMKAFEEELKQDFWENGRTDLRRQLFGTSLQWSAFLNERDRTEGQAT